jgi:prefoldin subunit 5
VLADVVDYADTFSGFQDSFKDALDRWAHNSPNAQQDLGDLIGALKSEIDNKLSNVQTVVVSLTGFRDNLLADSSAFNTDALQVNAVVNGDNGEIASLQEQLDDIQSKITGEIVGVALGSAAIIGGGILIVVGAATSVFGGAGVPVAILGGVLVATGVAVDIGVGSALADYENLKSALQEKLSTLKGEIVALTAVGATINQLAKSIDGAIEVANGLVTTWDSLSAEMGNLEHTITKAQDGDKAGKRIVVSAFLTTANNQWNDVHNLAVDIQTRFSSLNTEHVGELNANTVKKAARQAA